MGAAEMQQSTIESDGWPMTGAVAKRSPRPTAKMKSVSFRLSILCSFLDHSADRERISQFLNTLDIFSHGRRDGETFGNVFSEAMMHGKPCLSHWSPIANAQVETMGPAGLFAKDENDYADKLHQLFYDEKLRTKLGTNGKLYAEKHYSIKACMQELINIYHKVNQEVYSAHYWLHQQKTKKQKNQLFKFSHKINSVILLSKRTVKKIVQYFLT